MRPSYCRQIESGTLIINYRALRPLRRKFVEAIVSLCLLAASCQSSDLLTDADKQAQIATMYREYAREFPTVRAITATQLQQLQHQGNKPVLVDVRSPEEIAVSYIPGAITKTEFEQNLESYKDKTVIVYCTIGYRSGFYARKLQQRGIEVTNLAGSLLAWSHADGSLTDGRDKTRQVHVFGRQWQLTPESYEAVW